MKEFYRELYDNLVKGIEACEKKNTDFKQHIECCFHVCEGANLQVEKQLASTNFENEEEEIIFFKYIRPKFTSLVEFYSIVYRAELFLPERPVDKAEFWKSELQRAQAFLNDHKELSDYMSADETFQDREFFLKSSTHSFHGDLVGKIAAWQMYAEMLRKK